MPKNLLRFSSPKRNDGEKPVQDRLSYTPSQMMEMAEKGVAISTLVLPDDMFFDGFPQDKGTFEIPLECQRGVDVADTWQASQSIRKKAKKGLMQDIATFGKEVVIDA